MVEAAVRGPVLVGVDGSGAALRAVCWAADEAVRRKAPLRIVHAGAQGDGCTAEAAAMVAPGVELTTAVSAQPPLRALLEESETARMLVLGPTGLDAVPGVPAGSLPAKLAAHAHCPVTVVRGDEDRPAGPVVAGIDGGPLTEVVIATAFEEAANRGVRLVAVHSWSDADFQGVSFDGLRYLGWEPVADAERVLGESLAAWQEKYPEVVVDRVAVRDRPRHLLLEWSRRAQLVVAGHRGRGGFDGLALGSAAQALVDHAHGPVLVVRQPGSRWNG
ncbi:universal stress protein [Amycolatopsis acidiphila]|uniref:Universal stress protein n=1 Tax=Amycolatopsis acidiphila TaxID=715473 RepID=A0A557ZYL5_9PSEU|nr:universal stress protein [Amycolatopsis acidiphila]TVT17102.1 universal stress protein [Amycolatopsis acidiphila]UIJ61954.1 universal stress protein [Amycolatopsis acidiphila]GHG56938.1 universal stress protein [Amycolatopsis acidiphila]